MANNNRTPGVDSPELLDIVISDIQKGLTENLGWLDKAFGRAERLVKLNENGKKYYTPNVYVGGNEYMDVSPDANIGNFCFFWIDDPQNVDWSEPQLAKIDTEFSLIFWFDYRKVFNANIRNKEQVKREILDLLNGGFLIRNGRITINKIYELAENIYKGFSLDEIDNQFLMQPYGGFRFEGEMSIIESCKI